MAKTNIIYLTTRCNLRCDYCFEAGKREVNPVPQKDTTIERMDEFIAEIEHFQGRRIFLNNKHQFK